MGRPAFLRTRLGPRPSAHAPFSASQVARSCQARLLWVACPACCLSGINPLVRDATVHAAKGYSRTRRHQEPAKSPAAKAKPEPFARGCVLRNLSCRVGWNVGDFDRG